MSKINYDGLRREELIRIIEEYNNEASGGIQLVYKGQTPPWQIVRKVKPRAQKILPELSTGSEEDQSKNLIIEGENLQAMVSLYKYRGQVDLILTDPPYNTGNDFRYNDKWDEDPNDPDLGSLVPKDDGSKHSKWLRFMTPRIWMMKEMLKPGGILAICIDHRELFRLGMLLDKIFQEENIIGIINWQKTFSPKNDTKNLSTATEYVLIYSKSYEKAKTGLLPRDEKSDKLFGNRDDDPEGEWSGKDPTAKEFRKNTVFGIQSPFTGNIHYPDLEYRFTGDLGAPIKHWTGINKTEMKAYLEEWGIKYRLADLGDNRGKALVIENSSVRLTDYDPLLDAAVVEAKTKAMARYEQKNWPLMFFLNDRNGQPGCGRPRIKNYLKNVQRGKVPLTYWAEEDYDTPLILGAQSWDYQESGHSKAGIDELDNIMGKGHGFETVKPLKLFKKIIHLWCPPNGIVMDPFAGSGTSGHAVLELNDEIGASRRFVMIEQGRPERGDSYARSLTRERVRRAITGERPKPDRSLVVSANPLDGGFRFTELSQTVDADAVLALEREEMIDLLLTSHWDQNDRSASHLQRLPAGSYKFLFAHNARAEGYFLVWNGPNNPAVLDRAAFRNILSEVKESGLKAPYHVYARICTYSGPNIEFYQIPDRILDKLGFNQAIEPYHTEPDVKEE